MNKNKLYAINTFMRIAVDESVVDRMYDITSDSVRGMARGYSQSVFMILMIIFRILAPP